MKNWKTLSFACIALVLSSITANAQRNCGSMEVLQLQEDPKRAFMIQR